MKKKTKNYFKELVCAKKLLRVLGSEKEKPLTSK